MSRFLRRFTPGISSKLINLPLAPLEFEIIRHRSFSFKLNARLQFFTPFEIFANIVN